MKQDPIKIEIYYPALKMSTSLHVDQVSGNTFRAAENEIFNRRLTFGTEFETFVNEDGKHEIARIVKESEYVATRFFLTSQFKESEYGLLGDEIIKHGGFWQVDLVNIATINLPKNSELDLTKLFKTFDFNPTYLVD